MTPPHRWATGDYLTHRSNPELGIGRVTEVDGRVIVVTFPRANTTLRLAASTDALRPVDLGPGRRVLTNATREETTITERLDDGTLRLANGSHVELDQVWPLELEGALLERLASGDVDDVADFLLRLKILRLLELREARGLGSFLGGRIRLFPHQLYVAEQATTADPVRWLLADEVGLGKTIEAALIINRLVHTGRVQRCLVVVPEALTVQWLGELWRKYHQVFTLLDTPRLADVARDFGATFNPFDVHQRAVIALETLVARPELTEQAVRAQIDLLVVDEAQHLRRPPGHPGEPAWRAVAPIAALGRHVLLLSATPLEDDAHGFFRLLQLLRPDEFPEQVSVEARLTQGTPLPPCTSSTRRADIGGLPPRVPITVDLDQSSPAFSEVEHTLRREPAANPVERRRKIERIRRALASGAALGAVLRPEDGQLRKLAAQMDQTDARVEWLLTHGQRWRHANEKTLIFVAHRETLEMLRTALSHRGQLASGVFHEDLSAARRDTEVARFREADGPSLLVTTEAGGEGRNFEFCQRLVLFDLPWNPSTVEQRIGRLDRIGRRLPVEVIYFRPAAGIGSDAVRLLEALGVFREPLAGLEPQLAYVETALEGVAVDPDLSLTDERRQALVSEALNVRTRIQEAAYQQLHRNPYRAEMGPAILARVPGELDAMNEEVIVGACERLGLHLERPRGQRVYSIELGNTALVDSLPGVPGGATYIGTFDREEAVGNETIDFFASGHPLVEGIFAYFDDGGPGRVVALEVAIGDDRGDGLIAVYKNQVGFEVVACDNRGQWRPDWAEAIGTGSVVVRRPQRHGKARDASDLIARASGLLDPARRVHALAAIRVRPSKVRPTIDLR